MKRTRRIHGHGPPIIRPLRKGIGPREVMDDAVARDLPDAVAARLGDVQVPARIQGEVRREHERGRRRRSLIQGVVERRDMGAASRDDCDVAGGVDAPDHVGAGIAEDDVTGRVRQDVGGTAGEGILVDREGATDDGLRTHVHRGDRAVCRDLPDSAMPAVGHVDDATRTQGHAQRGLEHGGHRRAAITDSATRNSGDGPARLRHG
jgi:hypothetical protein